MELVKYEIIKLWGRKPVIFIPILLLVCNVFLIYIYEKNTEEYFYIHSHGEKYRTFLMGNESEDVNGYYRQEQESQEIYKETYYKFIAEMEQRADKMKSVSLFQNADSYVYRNLIKSVHDFAPFSEIDIKADNCYGVCAMAEYNIEILFLLIFLAVLSYYVIFWERDKKLLLLLKCSKKGHIPLAFAKLKIMVLGAAAFTVLLECSTIYIYGYLYGYGDVGRSIQSVPLFRNCTYRLSVVEAFVVMLLIRVLISVVLVCILFCVGMSIKNEISAAVIISVIFAAEFFFGKVFSISGIFGGIKSINPFYCWNMEQALGEYYNLNLFGYPISKNLLALSAAVILVFVLSVAGVFVFHRTCQIREESRLEVILQWIRQKMGYFNRHISLIYYEFYKVMIQQKKGIIWIALLIWWVSEVSGVFAVKYYGDAETASYHVYLNNIHGQITEETYMYMENETAYLNELRQKAISPDTVESMQHAYSAQLNMYEKGFALVQKQLALLEAKPGDITDKYLLDEIAYIELWKDIGTDIVFWFVGASVVLFFTISIAVVDEKKEMLTLVRSTLNGREQLEKSKTYFSVICTGAAFLIIESPLFLQYYRIDHFSTTMQKLCNFTTQNLTSNMVLGVMVVCVFVLKVCSFFVVCLFGKKLAEVMKNKMVAILVGIGILGLVALTLYHFKWDFNMIFLTGMDIEWN
ncbi:MAG: hypothetical protein NC433_03715 [Clostridiales bacterium]|nr:hypothetical protein [Clostridiales bacterium]